MCWTLRLQPPSAWPSALREATVWCESCQSVTSACSRRPVLRVVRPLIDVKRFFRYLAPNLVTFASLTFGMSSLVASIEGRWADAAWFVIFRPGVMVGRS